MKMPTKQKKSEAGLELKPANENVPTAASTPESEANQSEECWASLSTDSLNAVCMSIFYSPDRVYLQKDDER